MWKGVRDEVPGELDDSQVKAIVFTVRFLLGKVSGTEG